MDDPVCFQNFVRNQLGVTANNAANAINDFVPTFSDLLAVSDDKIDKFVTTIHGANSGLAAADKIVIPHAAVTGLQAMLFELRDRQKCDALPDMALLNAITAADLRSLRRARSTALRFADDRKDSTPAGMEIPKFKGSNFDEFMTAFRSLASRQIGANGLPLDYLMREGPPENYNNTFASREAKLKACILFQGDNFKADSEALYSLYVEHIGTTGIGSSTINKFKSSRNGFKCHHDLRLHYANRSYKDNKAQSALQSIANAVYTGPKRNFNIETYYTIMSTAFNDLESSGPEHHLNNDQKIAKFEAGLKEPNAINFSIQAKMKYDTLPIHDKTFDTYYNEFSALMTKFTTLSQAPPANLVTRRAQINATNTSTSRTNTGRGRGRGRTQPSGRGNNRGGGRNGSRAQQNQRRNAYTPYSNSRTSSFTPVYGNFVPEAKMYSPVIFNNLTSDQKKAIAALKAAQGWVNPTTPPPGFTIDSNTGFAVPSNTLVSAIQTATIGQTSFAPHYPIPPPPPRTSIPPAPPSVINVNPSGNANMSVGDASISRAGDGFARSGSRAPVTGVASVSINGQPYTGHVYDRYGNPLN